jgi:activator of HSP90 ATPase
MRQESGPLPMTRRQVLTAGALVSGALVLRDMPADANEARSSDSVSNSNLDATGISHTADAIHQEPEFAASAARVYAALLDPRQFDRIVEFSGVMQAMHLQKAASRIEPHAGGSFALFGGYITGRQLELVRNKRIVQAWRAASWDEGIHSIARFELQTRDAVCRIVFDHTGIPSDDAKSLAEGWQSHYWEPLRKVLSA